MTWNGKVHDVNILDVLLLEAGAIYVMDRGYQFERVYSHPVDKATGVQCDQTIVLSGFYSRKAYPDSSELYMAMKIGQELPLGWAE